MYGETHVDPVLLFDPDHDPAPVDALDLYFHAPISLSLVGDAFAFNRMDRELDQLLDVYAGLAGGIIRDVLAGEPSVLMRKSLYVTPAALSAGLFVGLSIAGLASWPAAAIAIAAGFALRGGAIARGWSLPAYGD